MGTQDNTGLRRELGLREAVALNMIDMVGIGPFIVIGEVVAQMHGPQALVAWMAGAGLALVDGFIWAELGAALPMAGGSYVFLRTAYGPEKWGRLMSFLFIWQTMFQAPLVMASAAIGFANYFQYLVPLDFWTERMVRGGLIVILVWLLYRRIGAIGKISIFIWVGVVATMAWLIFGGITNFNADQVFGEASGGWKWEWNWVFFAGLGAATVQTIYTYLGYYNVCHLGSEIREPERNIPRAIFVSIIGIAVLYLLMQTSILGVVPWQEVGQSKFVVSTFVEKLYGTTAAKFATGMILWIAFGSLFALTLGYTRIPYAAALDGTFFKVFGKVHSTKHFPHVSLLWLGAVGLAFAMLFRLREVIQGILAMRILVQFIGGAIGLWVLHQRWPKEKFPFKMWAYPVPIVMVVAAWFAIFLSTGNIVVRGVAVPYPLAGLGVMGTGLVVFLVRARVKKEWPFRGSEE